MIKLMTYLFVAVFSSALLGLPRHSAAKFLGLKNESKVWIRVLGGCGVCWLLLTMLVRDGQDVISLSVPAKSQILTAKHYFGGAIVAFFFVLYTKRIEKA